MLRVIFLLAMLSAVLLNGLYLNGLWRNHTSHNVCAMLNAASMPWPLTYLAYEQELRGLFPGGISIVPLVAITGAGFAVNMAIVSALALFTYQNLRNEKRS
jgi:hypothetical protein